jgi:ABC-type antimicrobial peptide transport system permease subunit
VEVSGGPALPRTEQVAAVNAVEPVWFDTYGMRLLAGRDFAASDRGGSEQVVIVNEAFVRRFVGPRNPLGQRIRGVGLGRLKESVIVGVVNDAIYRTARLGIFPTMYLPMEQADLFGSAFAITAKLTSGRPVVESSLTEALLREDPDLTFSYRNYGDQVRATIVQERLVAMLSGFFGVLALLLAALGLYGVAWYSVSHRLTEIALRMALGESAGGVMRLVLGSVGRLIACGAVIGVVLSLWAAQFVDALTFGVDPRDSTTLAGTASTLAVVGLFAAWLPARKASRVDPAITLKG